MSNSVRPHRRQPTRLHHPWDSPGKNTGVGCHFLLQCMKVKSESEVAQSCPTPSDPMDCSPPGFSVHGIWQARVLEWVAIAFSNPILAAPQPPGPQNSLWGWLCRRFNLLLLQPASSLKLWRLKCGDTVAVVFMWVYTCFIPALSSWVHTCFIPALSSCLRFWREKTEINVIDPST